MKDPKVMYALSYGMFVLCARQGVKDNGCITNTGMQITDQPNRMAFTISKKNYTHDMVAETGVSTLSVLSEEADFDIYKRFGFQSGRTADKVAGFEQNTARGDNGVLYLTRGTSAWIAGKVYSAIDLGSHTLFLADVTGGEFLSKAPSATYAYYQAHVKPKPAAPAPAKHNYEAVSYTHLTLPTKRIV